MGEAPRSEGEVLTEKERAAWDELEVAQNHQFELEKQIHEAYMRHEDITDLALQRDEAARKANEAWENCKAIMEVR